jgi:hypothetical protein
MSAIRRKKKWQRVVGKAAGEATHSTAVRTGAGAVAGAMTLTAASAALSAIRRKTRRS